MHFNDDDVILHPINMRFFSKDFQDKIDFFLLVILQTKSFNLKNKSSKLFSFSAIFDYFQKTKLSTKLEKRGKLNCHSCILLRTNSKHFSVFEILNFK